MLDKYFMFTLSQLFRDEGYCFPSSETGEKYSTVKSFLRLFLKCNFKGSIIVETKLEVYYKEIVRAASFKKAS